jgi:xanthine dehydrogenase accessory factor
VRTILDALDRLPRDGWALARVTDVIDRAPLRAGDAIAVRDDDAVIGSLACGAEHVRAELAADRAAVLETLLPDSEDVFVQRFLPRPQMVLVGATQFARALSSVGRLLGYRVTVCDARAPFADPAAFPEADEVVVGWGEDVIRNCGLDERAAVCFLAHDRRSDVAALAAALGTPAGYIGAWAAAPRKRTVARDCFGWGCVRRTSRGSPRRLGSISAPWIRRRSRSRSRPRSFS